MQNFVFQNGVKIYFGKGVVKNLGSEVSKVTKKVLVVYGGGSIKRNGIYTNVIDSLIEYGIEYVELSGVDPNPHISTVRQGQELCKEHQLGAVIAVGGGSVIDCSKVICAAACYHGDPWDFLIKKEGVENALPLFTILTLAATGSEMNCGAVITNEMTNEKFDVSSDHMYPLVSFLDPSYTFSVSKFQTAAGTADIMSHILEQYFGDVDGSYLQDRLAEALLKTCITYGPIAIRSPFDYEARANLMWTSSLALNNLLSSGHDFPWIVHPIEHPLSGFFDITHGAGLASLTPNYFLYVLNRKNAKKFKQFAVNVFNVETANKSDMQIAKDGIEQLALFFEKMGLPRHLEELGVKKDLFEKMALQTLKGRETISCGLCTLNKDDIVKILEMSF